MFGPCTFTSRRIFFGRHSRASTSFRPPVLVDPRGKNRRRVFAVGDIHGDFKAAVCILQALKLVSRTGHWIGKESLVVFCGDLLDRSGRGFGDENDASSEFDLLQYLHALRRQARESGGCVVTLMGNHEWMRMFDAFAAERFVGTQHRGYAFRSVRQLLKWSRPGGVFARYVARYMPAVFRSGDLLFCHGGLTLNHARKRGSLGAIAEPFWLAAAGAREAPEDLTVLWDRSWASGHEKPDCKAKIREILSICGAKPCGAMIVGHTIQDGGKVRSYCENQVWAVDVALSQAFGPRSTVGALAVHPKRWVFKAVHAKRANDGSICREIERLERKKGDPMIR